MPLNIQGVTVEIAPKSAFYCTFQLNSSWGVAVFLNIVFSLASVSVLLQRRDSMHKRVSNLAFYRFSM